MLKFRILFIIFLIFILSINIAWMKNDYQISGGPDVTYHFFVQLNFSKLFTQIISSPLNIFEKIKQTVSLLSQPVRDIGFFTGFYYPNFTYFITSLFNFVLGGSLFVSRISMLFFMLILSLSTFLIARKIANEKVAFFSVLFLFLYPLIYESVRQYTLDFPLTAFVCCSIYLLMQGDYFKSRFYSLALGLVAGIGMNVKGQEALFIAFPIAWTVMHALLKIKRNEIHFDEAKKVLINFLIFLALFIMVSAIWWGGKDRITFAISSLKEHISEAFFGTSNIAFHFNSHKYSPSIAFFYVNAFFKNSIGPILFITFLLALVNIFVDKYYKKIKDWIILMLWIVPPFILFSLFFSYKFPRFLMPVLPAISIITAIGIWKIKNNFIRYITLSLFLLVGASNFYYTTQKEHLITVGGMPFRLSTSEYAVHPVKEDMLDGLKEPLSSLRLIENSYVGVIVLHENALFEYLYKLKLIEPKLFYLDLLGIDKANNLVEYFRDFPAIVVFSKDNNIPYGEGLIRALKKLYPGEYEGNFTLFSHRMPGLKEITNEIPNYFYKYKEIKLNNYWVSLLKNKYQ